MIPEKKNETTRIVGIGASAGGLEAITAFFSFNSSKHKNGPAFVIVLHLSPDYKSIMVDLLGKKTNLPVHQIEHNIKVKPNNIYIIPPNKQLLLKGDTLKLSPRSGSGNFHPINVFFSSLAQEKKEKAIAVILSGSGNDGSKGIVDVKQEGGMTVVSDPGYAKFDGMPKNAINTGVVDLVLPPDEMQQEIERYIELSDKGNDKDFIHKISLDKNNLNHIFELIREKTDIDFSVYKKNTIIRRIQRRMAVTKKQNLKKYVEFLYLNESEIDLLKNEFLIGVSSFFRDEAAFVRIEKEIISKIYEGVDENEPIRIWCPGCSTGQEAYSLAILFEEYSDRHQIYNRLKIFASDIDKLALERANIGEYSLSIENEVPPHLLEKYFTITAENTFKVNQRIRDKVVFAHHNLLNDPPFTKLNLISCRNLLIYIEADMQKTLMGVFHYALKNNSYLFLGSSETLGSYNHKDIEFYNKKHKIYFIRQSAKFLSENFLDKNISIPSNNNRFVKKDAVATIPYIKSIEKYFNTQLMRSYIPPSIYVDKKMDILHLYGNTDNYLTLPRNTVRLHFEDMIEESLRIVLSAGIKQVFQKNKPTYYADVECTLKGVAKVIDVDIIPHYVDQINQTVVQVSFIKTKESDNKKKPKTTTKVKIDEYTKNRIADLEYELKEYQQNLQSVTQEMETTNEELQATNEELLSANEELQSTNEELQSVNEELLTVNAEHQAKIAELMELNDDMHNLLKNIDVGTLFLDNKLNIRRFTDAVSVGLNLRQRDIGRPLHEIKLKFDYPDFKKDAKKVLEKGSIIAKELFTENNQWLMIHLLPYKTSRGLINGVVVTLYNVTELKNLNQVYEDMAEKFKLENAKLNLLLEGFANLIIEFDTKNNIVAVIEGKNYVSPLLEEGKSITENLIDKNLNDLEFVPDNLKKSILLLIERSKKSKTTVRKNIEIKDKKGKDIYLSIRIEPANNNHITSVIRDITELHTTQIRLDNKIEELSATNKKLQQYIDSNLELEKFAYVASHDMKEPLRSIISFSQLIQRKIEKNDTNNLDELLDFVINSGQRMFNLIENMLEYTKIEHKDFNPQVVDLDALIKRIIGDHVVSIQSKNIKFEIDQMGEIVGDEMLLYELFLNLVSNAIKFTDKPKPKIKIKNKSNKSDYKFTVEDNGIGIDQAYYDHIFTLFKRLEKREDFEGTGIGLSICRQVVEKHNGTISVKSKKGAGSEFIIVIPKG